MVQLSKKLKHGEVRTTFSEAAVKKAYCNYSFEFDLDGVTCRAGNDPQRGTWHIVCPDSGARLHAVAEELEATIQKLDFSLEELVDVRKFLCKHLQTMMKVEEELQRAPASERYYEVLNPIDMTATSLELQCVFEVIQEHRAQQAVVANRALDASQGYKISAELVEAKMKEKMRQLN